MSRSSINIINNVAIPTTGSRGFNAGVADLSATTWSFASFEVTVVNGATPPIEGRSVTVSYGFSDILVSPTSNAPHVIVPVGAVDVKLDKLANSTKITDSPTVPVTGNYAYAWINVTDVIGKSVNITVDVVNNEPLRIVTGGGGGGSTVLLSDGGKTIITGTDDIITSSNYTFPANSLVVNDVISVESYGSFVDPGANQPSASFAFGFGGNTITFVGGSAANLDTWILRFVCLIQSAGPSSDLLTQAYVDVAGGPMWPRAFGITNPGINLTIDQEFSITGHIDNFTSAETINVYTTVVRKN